MKPDELFPRPDRHVTQRHECKYLVPERVARSVQSSLSPFLEPDPHAARTRDGTYPIASLYLDSEDLRLYHETVDGLHRRFKLRVRSYDDAADSPLFLEIKRRIDRITRKVRCRLPRELGYRVLDGRPVERAKLNPSQAEAHDEFLALMERIRARPRVVVRYDRTAFVGAFDRSVRVTFDRRLRTLATERSEVPVDRTDFLSVEDRLVVLELKFNDICPSWMARVVRRHELQRCSYSKYCHSVDRAKRGPGRNGA